MLSNCVSVSFAMWNFFYVPTSEQVSVNILSEKCKNGMVMTKYTVDDLFL